MFTRVRDAAGSIGVEVKLSASRAPGTAVSVNGGVTRGASHDVAPRTA
jgi:hypothetical protein